MNIHVQVTLSARDGERTVVRNLAMPAPPFAGLHVVGRGWDVLVGSVTFVADRGDYRADCQTVRSEDVAIADLLRTFEIEGWRVTGR